MKLASLTGATALLGACGINLPSSKEISTLELIESTDPRYNVLRQGFNKRIDKHPRAIAVCHSTADVAEAVHYARDHNLPIAVKSGGHSMEGFSNNDDGLVINLSMMNNVELRSDNTVKAGPGCTLSRLYDELLPKQRLIPAGSCGTVALGGLTTGGGYGFFSRQYGLTCDNLREATVVDGNGLIRSTRSDAELMWALRGGGSGNFCIVTEMIFDSHSAPISFQSHHFKSRKLIAKNARKILEKWFLFSAQLPESCFSAFVLNGSTLNILVTNFKAHSNEIEQQLASFGRIMEERKSDPSIELAQALKRYYGSLVPVAFKNSSAGFYRDFGDIENCIDAVLEKVTKTPGLIYQINTLGGNITNPDFEKVSCYAHRQYNFISELQAYWQKPAHEERLALASREILKLFEGNGVSAQYVNYCSTEFNKWPHAYYGNNYSRLQAVKRRLDPDNRIRHPQSITA